MPTTASPSTVAEAIAAIRRRRATRQPFHSAAHLAVVMHVRAVVERMVANPFA